MLETEGKLALIKQMPHMMSALVATEFGIRGYVGATSVASAASTVAIGEAFRLIKDGYMDIVLVGGLDYNCDGGVIDGMNAFGAVTTSFNADPEAACRPFDVRRSGTVLSDGGGMILLESLESAKSRKAKNIYAEISGFGITCDAYHILRPTDTGVGLIKAI